MRRNFQQPVSVLLVILVAFGPTPLAYGRGGGRGGGGGARMAGGGGARPGGGMSRPSPSVGRSPSFSPAARPGGGISRPGGGISAGGARPGGAGPGGTRPGGVGGGGLSPGGARPGGIGGPAGRPTTPGLTPGSRPGTVDFGGSRPGIAGGPGLTPGTRPPGPGASQLPASPRPGIGGGGISQLPSGPGANRPGAGGGAGGRPGAGGPGISQLPANRPGGGALVGAGIGAGSALLPGLGNRPGGGDGLGGNRPGQLPNRTPGERHDNLQDRLASRNDFRDGGRGDRQDNRDQRRDDRPTNRDDIREDWQDRYGNIYDRHEDWHHGCWHGNHSDWWNHMWSEHTALMAFGTTMWGVNRAAWGFGYWGYQNPYYTESYPVDGGYSIDYSQPIAVDSQPVAATTAAASAPADAPAPGMSDFDAARDALYRGEYSAALMATNKALAALPNDPIIHEFRALVLFAQGKYQESAAGLYSVLSVGPGWDWTTLISLYPNVDVYTKQLRALEAAVKQRPQAMDARFVLAYHYLTCGNKDHAATQLKAIYEQRPQDNLVKQLLLMTGGPEAIGAPAPPAEAEKPAGPAIAASDVVGNWNASGPSKTTFALQLAQDGTFSWTYTQNGKAETVKGVYALDGNVLAMEPESGGTMLAELTPPRSGQMEFRLLGAPPGDAGLTFQKKA